MVPFTFTLPSVMRSSALLLDATPALAITYRHILE